MNILSRPCIKLDHRLLVLLIVEVRSARFRVRTIIAIMRDGNKLSTRTRMDDRACQWPSCMLQRFIHASPIPCLCCICDSPSTSFQISSTTGTILPFSASHRPSTALTRASAAVMSFAQRSSSRRAVRTLHEGESTRFSQEGLIAVASSREAIPSCDTRHTSSLTLLLALAAWLLLMVSPSSTVNRPPLGQREGEIVAECNIVLKAADSEQRHNFIG